MLDVHDLKKIKLYLEGYKTLLKHHRSIIKPDDYDDLRDGVVELIIKTKTKIHEIENKEDEMRQTYKNLN